jgi:hypothetical protein
LQFSLSNKTYPGGLPIIVYGFLAELLFPYLNSAWFTISLTL